MNHNRASLPPLEGGLFLSDGGIETTLIFHDGLTLPDFAAFPLLREPAGEAALRRYFRSYVDIARRFQTGLILETPTWRASPEWGRRLGYDAEDLNRANHAAVALLEDLRAESGPFAISGCVGPRGDGYVPGSRMAARQAADYHRAQIAAFAETTVDVVTAITMNYVEEAIGIAQAAREAGVPAVISFTVETDGRLPSGQRLGDAILEVDAATNDSPAYYMINCAHPTHFHEVLQAGQARWLRRIRGVRANASRMSHAELNDSPTLDVGNPEELGQQYADLMRVLPNLNVMGGCCGTDDRHVARIAEACAPLFRA